MKALALFSLWKSLTIEKLVVHMLGAYHWVHKIRIFMLLYLKILNTWRCKNLWIFFIFHWTPTTTFNNEAKLYSYIIYKRINKNELKISVYKIVLTYSKQIENSMDQVANSWQQDRWGLRTPGRNKFPHTFW